MHCSVNPHDHVHACVTQESNSEGLNSPIHSTAAAVVICDPVGLPGHCPSAAGFSCPGCDVGAEHTTWGSRDDGPPSGLGELEQVSLPCLLDSMHDVSNWFYFMLTNLEKSAHTEFDCLAGFKNLVGAEQVLLL